MIDFNSCNNFPILSDLFTPSLTFFSTHWGLVNQSVLRFG